MTPAERSRIWREQNPERHRVNMEKHRAIRSAKGPAHRREENLKRLYKMDLAAEADMLESQSGGCAICGTNKPSKGAKNNRQWYVDHDHSCCQSAVTCGKCVRGLLCSKCNVGMGRFNDDPELLEKAAQFIRNHRVG